MTTTKTSKHEILCPSCGREVFRGSAHGRAAVAGDLDLLEEIERHADMMELSLRARLDRGWALDVLVAGAEARGNRVAFKTAEVQ